ASSRSAPPVARASWRSSNAEARWKLRRKRPGSHRAFFVAGAAKGWGISGAGGLARFRHNPVTSRQRFREKRPMSLMRTKAIDPNAHTGLRRCLTAWDLTLLGIGCVIGTGI